MSIMKWCTPLPYVSKNGGSPEVLPQILLEQTLLEAIQKQFNFF